MMILIKGAGDLATGIAYRLKRSGFDIVMTEINKPTTVRRTVAFSQAIFDNEITIEGVKGIKVNNINELYKEINKGNIPIIIDEGKSIEGICHRPEYVCSILRKKYEDKIDEKDIAKLLSSEKGQKKFLDKCNNAEYRAIINKVDNEELLYCAEKICKYLKEKDVQAVITSYKS